MISYYHVTFTRHLKRIRKHGIKTFQTTNWIKAGDQSRYGNGGVYAFEKEYDAIRWAAKMDWDHYQKTGSGKISIVSFIPIAANWTDDDADPLSQAGAQGRWLRSRLPVSPDRILGAHPVTLDMARSLNEYGPYKRRL